MNNTTKYQIGDYFISFIIFTTLPFIIYATLTSISLCYLFLFLFFVCFIVGLVSEYQYSKSTLVVKNHIMYVKKNYRIKLPLLIFQKNEVSDFAHIHFIALTFSKELFERDNIIIKFLIGHELCHLKYDFNFKLLLSLVSSFQLESDYSRLKRILIETRADINSMNLLNATDNDKKSLYLFIEEISSDNSYNNGYLPSDKRISILENHNEFNEKTIELVHQLYSNHNNLDNKKTINLRKKIYKYFNLGRS